MNKILPIILVVVLSGCGKSPLENCADKLMYNKHGLYFPGSFQEKLKEYDGFLEAAARCEKLKKQHPETFNQRFK